MITGKVNAYREAVITLKVLGSEGREQQIEAVVDTGFTGFLTLPSAFIAALRLPWRRRGRAELADGSATVFDVYEARVLWDGEDRRIAIDSAETEPLIGMSLLYGYALTVQVIDGGSVTIQKVGAESRLTGLMLTDQRVTIAECADWEVGTPMTLVLELTRDEEDQLREKAAQRGQDVLDYTLGLVRQDLHQEQPGEGKTLAETLAGRIGRFEHDGPGYRNRPANYDQNAAPSPHTHSIMELEGLGADLWRNEQGNLIDAQEYVDDLRREWDDRP